MSKKLFAQAMTKFLLGMVLVGALIFGSAGTWKFPNGWLFMGVLFIPIFLAGVVLMLKNPQLLHKRLNGKETRREQDLMVKLSGLMFLAGFLVAGLDFRFGWCPLPTRVSVVAAVIFLGAYLMYAEVLRENVYLSRTVEIQENQTVVDTGLYGVVRHPMYSATLFLFLAMPLILGSVYAFVIFLAYPLLIAKRIESEETLLEAGLEGYREYKHKVKYRLIPLIW